MKRTLAVILLLSACTPAPTVPVGGTPTGDLRYICKGGTALPISYARENGEDVARLTIDGATSLLIRETEAPGLRYSWPSDGSNHVWLVNGGIGTLLWKDGTRGGRETVVLATCRA